MRTLGHATKSFLQLQLVSRALVHACATLVPAPIVCNAMCSTHGKSDRICSIVIMAQFMITSYHHNLWGGGGGQPGSTIK